MVFVCIDGFMSEEERGRMDLRKLGLKWGGVVHGFVTVGGDNGRIVLDFLRI